MSDDPKPAAIDALAAPPRRPQVSAPPELFPRFAGRLKRALGDSFGLTNFGVNIVELSPGAISSMRHAHTSQDEFVYVIKGMPSLFNNDGETLLEPGMCVGFRAGSDDAHQLVNRTDDEVVYLEVGDRTVPDDVAYPDDDLAISVDGSGKVYFRHKDGTLYKNSNSLGATAGQPARGSLLLLAIPLAASSTAPYVMSSWLIELTKKNSLNLQFSSSRFRFRPTPRPIEHRER